MINALLRYEMYGPHHLPLGANVGSGPQDHQQARLIGQMEEILQISVSIKVVDTLHWLMEVPGHIPVVIRVLMNIAQCNTGDSKSALEKLP